MWELLFDIGSLGKATQYSDIRAKIYSEGGSHADARAELFINVKKGSSSGY